MIPGRQGCTCRQSKRRGSADVTPRHSDALLRSAAASGSFGATTAPQGTAIPALDANAEGGGATRRHVIYKKNQNADGGGGGGGGGPDTCNTSGRSMPSSSSKSEAARYGLGIPASLRLW
jgi:hypothetical protein